MPPQCRVNLSGLHVPRDEGRCRCGHELSAAELEALEEARRQYEYAELRQRYALGLAS